MIGIETVASPDDDGIRNDSGRKSRYITMANAASPTSPSAVSAQCSTVSVIWPLFMTTVMPRAMPMISATPRRSSAPSTNVVVSSPSFIPPMTPMMMAKSRNDAVISGNHHHSVGTPMPEVLPRDHAVDHHEERQCRTAPSTTFCSPGHHDDLAAVVGGGARSAASLTAFMSYTSDFVGSRADPFGVAEDEPDAHGEADDQEDQPPDEAVARAGCPAKSEAIPVAKGLIVEPRTPMPHPSRITARADQRRRSPPRSSR